MMNAIDKQRLDELAGARRADATSKRRAAIRLEDMATLLELPQLQSAKAAGASVTVAEFDALVSDVRAMHRTLSLISTRLSEKLR